MVDRCVVCGDIVPEGRQVCMKCELTNPKEFTSMIKKQVNTIKLTIPEIPPSNNKFMGRGSQKYQAFEYQNEKRRWEWLVKAAIKDKPKKPFQKAEVKIVYYFKTLHRRDPDNYSGKFILDGLTSAGIIRDDSFSNIDLILKGKVDRKNPRTEIYVREVGT